MVSKELLDYIKSVKEKGYNDDAIKQHLLKHGYAQTIIDEAFSANKTYADEFYVCTKYYRSSQMG